MSNAYPENLSVFGSSIAFVVKVAEVKRHSTAKLRLCLIKLRLLYIYRLVRKLPVFLGYRGQRKNLRFDSKEHIRCA